jgi:hypothetical protein
MVWSKKLDMALWQREGNVDEMEWHEFRKENVGRDRMGITILVLGGILIHQVESY